MVLSVRPRIHYRMYMCALCQNKCIPTIHTRPRTRSFAPIRGAWCTFSTRTVLDLVLLLKRTTINARGQTQRHAVGAKVRVFVRNTDELANERAELARLLNKAGTCFLHEMSQSAASGVCGGSSVPDPKP
jgi:hypothetical protein